MNQNTKIDQEMSTVHHMDYFLLHLKGVINYTQLQKPKSTYIYNSKTSCILTSRTLKVLQNIFVATRKKDYNL